MHTYSVVSFKQRSGPLTTKRLRLSSFPCFCSQSAVELREEMWSAFCCLRQTEKKKIRRNSRGSTTPRSSPICRHTCMTRAHSNKPFLACKHRCWHIRAPFTEFTQQLKWFMGFSISCMQDYGYNKAIFLVRARAQSWLNAALRDFLRIVCVWVNIQGSNLLWLHWLKLDNPWKSWTCGFCAHLASVVSASTTSVGHTSDNKFQYFNEFFELFLFNSSLTQSRNWFNDLM